MIVGIDAGGTFTDFVFPDAGGDLQRLKVASTPDDPARAVLEGLERLLPGSPHRQIRIVHGSTVATNTLLERSGAKLVLLTTEGFEDVIEIGRQARRNIYDLAATKSRPLAAAEDRIGVPERLGPHGEEWIPLDDAAADRVVEAVAAREPESVAICLLHSYAESEHELELVRRLRERRPGLFVTASCEVLPEFREYERMSTTAINAYVGPVTVAYLAGLTKMLGADGVRIMGSAGGVISLGAASRRPVATILSGPAAGAVAGFEIGCRAGTNHVITFDMGGTSTDVSLCDGQLPHTSEAEVDGLPIRLPVLDIHTVGAGGGSIAWRDPGGSLRVGPASAGADPGPICYGAGGDTVTVTDANLYLGRLLPDRFLGGERVLYPDLVVASIEVLARRLDLEPRAAAEGVLRVANVVMERAIRVISLERGHDPRDFTLVCFGGAGGLHAAELARSLAIPRVLVPPGAGTLSAFGTLLAEPAREASRSILTSCARLDPTLLEAEFERLEAETGRELEDEGFRGSELRFKRSLDMRYVGQGFELSVPYGPDYRARHCAGHAPETEAGRTWRARSRGRGTGTPRLRVRGRGARGPAVRARAPAGRPPDPRSRDRRRVRHDDRGTTRRAVRGG
jgi:N-methylhydantoinase A